MFQNRHKNNSLKVMLCFAMAILALFNVHTHIASAAENYFTTEGDTLELDELDPEVRTKTTQE